MEYRFLGPTGMKVSELCLGTMTFGWQIDEATSHALLDRFVEAGGNFVDTADVYGEQTEVRGGSERIIGRWLERQNRDDLVIATKVTGPTGPGVNDQGQSRKHIRTEVESSLRRLRTDYIDLYQLHGWDSATRPEQMLRTLDDLVTSGKVRYLGVSNGAGWQIQRALDLSDAQGWERFVCLQPQYSLLSRSCEWELLPLAREAGLGVLPWSPLCHGWLSGKYRRGASGPPTGTRIAVETVEYGWTDVMWEAMDRSDVWDVIDAVASVASETGKTPAQVALNWLLRQPDVTAPIIGARSPEQLDDNLGAVGWALTPDQVERLTKASEQPKPYPYALLSDRRAG